MKVKQMWREKRLAREECSGSKGSDQEENDNDDKMGVNRVFVLPEEFRAPEVEVVEFALGARLETFEKPEKWDNT
jgi:hypothetical protein